MDNKKLPVEMSKKEEKVGRTDKRVVRRSRLGTTGPLIYPMPPVRVHDDLDNYNIEEVNSQELPKQNSSPTFFVPSTPTKRKRYGMSGPVPKRNRLPVKIIPAPIPGNPVKTAATAATPNKKKPNVSSACAKYTAPDGEKVNIEEEAKECAKIDQELTKLVSVSAITKSKSEDKEPEGRDTKLEESATDSDHPVISHDDVGGSFDLFPEADEMIGQEMNIIITSVPETQATVQDDDIDKSKESEYMFSMLDFAEIRKDEDLAGGFVVGDDDDDDFKANAQVIIGSDPKIPDPETIMVGKYQVMRTPCVVPNAKTMDFFDRLPSEKQERLRSVLVGRFYECREPFILINDKLKDLYNIPKEKNSCMVCAHLNLHLIVPKEDEFYISQEEIYSFPSEIDMFLHYKECHREGETTTEDEDKSD